MKTFRRNNIVLKRDSIYKKWKSFFKIVDVDRKFVYCTRCSINTPTSYVHKFPKEDVILMTETRIRNSRYIKKQLNRVLLPGMTMFIYLKISDESLVLLEQKIDIVAFYTKLRGQNREYVKELYEVFSVEAIYLQNEYTYKGFLTKQWLKVKIGAKFQRHLIS